MEELLKGVTLEKAALRSGMSENTARRYVRGAEAKGQRRPRKYRTRRDPFEAVWAEIVSMLEAAPGLEAKTIFERLRERQDIEFGEGQLRTLQRKIKRWRAEHGPGKEVFFPQHHRPGEYAQSDFTSMNSLGITLAGEWFDHLLYHFVLPYSNWEHGVVCFSESYESLIRGFQCSVEKLGRVPKYHRTDNLSAATHDLSGGGRDFNRRYSESMLHYGVIADRNTPGRAHENGDVEQAHHRFKKAVDQALLLRGTRDFATRADYETFLGEIFEGRNRRRIVKLADELRAMHELPAVRLEEFRRERVRVTRNSTILVAGNHYSVRSQLIGEWVDIRMSADTIQVWHGERHVAEIERLRGKGQTRIDYRHVIWSLIRKPGAFARYQFRQALFPTANFRRAYDTLVERCAARADVEYVRILHLAASTSETAVDAALGALLASGELRDYAQVRELASPEPIDVPACDIQPPDLKGYDELVMVGGEQ